MQIISLLSIYLVTVLFVFCGCASVPNTLNQQYRDVISKVAILTIPKNKELQVLDHRKFVITSYTGYQYGAIGGLIEGIIIGAERQVQITKSLSGNLEPLKTEVVRFPINNILNEKIQERIQKRYKVIANDQTNGLASDPDITKYMEQCRFVGIDTAIIVDYIYGLAVYVGEPASVAIDADIQIWDVKLNKLLCQERITSDRLFKQTHTVPEFTENNCKMFEEGMYEATGSIALQIATKFNIDSDEAKNKIIEDVFNFAAISCGAPPYNIDQDCSSWSGAKRIIEIDGQRMKIAGSNDGKTILVMSEGLAGNAAKEIFSLGISTSITDSNIAAMNIIRKFLLSENIGIIKTTKLVSSGDVYGYILILDKPGYSIIKTYSNEKELS